MENPHEKVTESNEERLQKLIAAVEVVSTEMSELTQQEISLRESSIKTFEKTIQQKIQAINNLQLKMKTLLESFMSEQIDQNLPEVQAAIKDLHNKIDLIEQQKQGLIMEYEHKFKSSFQ
jgi:phage-related protein